MIAKVDTPIVAQLHAVEFLPEVRAADDDTLALRRFILERVAASRSIRRVDKALHANIIPKHEGLLFGKEARR